MNETAPSRFCDIVMKGGITSGVVYPLAITELAEEFRFKSIGGTSAGAIAAAVTAAAEYQRVTKGSAEGFRQLAKLPEFLAGETKGEKNLLNLFPPVKPTRGLFRLAMSFIGDRPLPAKLAVAALRLLWVSLTLTLLCFLPAVIAVVLMAMRGADAVFVTLTALLFLTGWVVLAVVTAVRALCFTLPRHNFGFSTGLKPEDRDLPGVTDWLHGELQRAAGRTPQDAPLTFGDLWTADGTASRDDCRNDEALRSIDLKMITTALTHGRPYELPFSENRFAFRASELQRYFTPDVVSHLTAKGQHIHDDLYQLPPAEELPVIVATRMSLSFPILFSLVPLYAIDYTMPEGADGKRPYERSWFIDGGLCSNFPLNMFDSLLPRWPTFGINLASPHEAYPIGDEECRNIWMVDDNRAGQENRWIRIPREGAPAIGGYVAALLDTIRNWRDNTQMSAAGFRDRVVHVVLGKDEGGLNLDMDDRKVGRLLARGRCAGELLRRRFGVAGATSGPLNWNSHRWTRYKIAMAALQKAMRSLDAAYSFDDRPYPGYSALVARTKDEEPKTGYWWDSRRTDYETLTRRFVEFAASIREAPDFSDEAPRRKPRLRLTPRL